MKPHLVVVDGYSAGNLLAPEAAGRGIPVLHVQSTPEIWPVLLPTFRPEDYEGNFAFDGDLERVSSELRRYPIAGVVAGTETGVELADRLSEALGLPSTNGTRLSPARREKFEMGEAVRAHGLRAARQLRSADAESIIAWAAAEGLDRVVIKPVASAGTDGFAVCDSPDAVRRAVGSIVGTVNKLGLPNHVALAQEFLAGTEYFVDAVSRMGSHHFTDLWRYRKRSINGHDSVYDCNELLPHDGEVENRLRAYVSGVLDALGIQWGPSHTEVMLTPEGPVLVESGARLDGLSVPTVNREAIGFSPVDLTVDLYSDDAAFESKTSTGYRLRKSALTVYLTSYEAGTVTAIPGEEGLRNLASFFQMRLRVKPGSPIAKTTNYFTAPGFLTLVHEDRHRLMGDYEAIRALERSGGLFTVEGAPP